MYDSTITLFNYHAATNRWYPTVITGADLGVSEASNATRGGHNNANTVTVLINTSSAKLLTTTAGAKRYTRPKEYAECSDPKTRYTFTPELDFLFEGAWPDLTPIVESEEDDGLYQKMNSRYDGVHMVQAVEYFGLLPHFEIGGR